MSKCILLVRVSTQRQDFDEQEEQLYQIALRDGFKEEDIIPISEKESGIKLKENERKGLNRMKEEIEKGGVSTVYAWEPSRIARKKVIGYSIVDYLGEHRVQLIIKEPYLKVFDENGQIIEASDQLLTILFMQAESEMRSKQARWKRTREANAKNGKWNGGKNIKFGYLLDDKNYYIVNEEEAKVIRLAYQLYTTTEMGQSLLRKELAERGYKLSLDRIQKILSDVGYTGEPYRTTVYINGKQSQGYSIQYPQIISMELFKQAEAKRLKSNVECYRGQSFYFARNIFRCPHCGYAYQGYKTTRMYCCLAWKHDNQDIQKCYNGVTININALDTLLWHVGMTQWMIFRMKNTEEYRNGIQNEMNNTAEKIDSCWRELESVDEKLEKIGDLYADGVYSKEKYQSKVNSVRQNAEETKRKKQHYEEEYKRLEDLYDNLSSDRDNQMTERLANTLETAFSIDDLKQMSEIVHQFVKSVEVEDAENIVEGLNKKSKTKKVTITRTDGVVETYYAYNFGEHVYMFWDENKKRIHPKRVLRKLGR